MPLRKRRPPMGGLPTVPNGAVGDLLVRGLRRYARLGIGTVGQVLTSTGTTAVWAAAGGGGAPSTADYLVRTADAGLSAERVVTDTPSLAWDWGTAGQGKAGVVFGSTSGVAMEGDAVPLQRSRLGWTANAVPGGTTLSTGAGVPSPTGLGTQIATVDATGCWCTRRCAANNTAAGQVLGSLFYRLDQPTAWLEWMVRLPDDTVNMRWFCGLTAGASFGNGTALSNNSVTFRYLPDDGDSDILVSYRNNAGAQVETAVMATWVPSAVARFRFANDGAGGIVLSANIAGTITSTTLSAGAALPTTSTPMRSDYRVWRQGLGGVATDAHVGYVCGQTGGL